MHTHFSHMNIWCARLQRWGVFSSEFKGKQGALFFSSSLLTGKHDAVPLTALIFKPPRKVSVKARETQNTNADVPVWTPPLSRPSESGPVAWDDGVEFYAIWDVIRLIKGGPQHLTRDRHLENATGHPTWNPRRTWLYITWSSILINHRQNMFKAQKKIITNLGACTYSQHVFDVLVVHLVIRAHIRRTHMKVLGFEEE